MSWLKNVFSSFSVRFSFFIGQNVDPWRSGPDLTDLTDCCQAPVLIFHYLQSAPHGDPTLDRGRIGARLHTDICSGGGDGDKNFLILPNIYTERQQQFVRSPNIPKCTLTLSIPTHQVNSLTSLGLNNKQKCSILFK